MRAPTSSKGLPGTETQSRKICERAGPARACALGPAEGADLTKEAFADRAGRG